jgi:hypothetical protein
LAAKAAVDFAALTTRLEAAPFPSRVVVRVFQQPVRKRKSHLPLP